MWYSWYVGKKENALQILIQGLENLKYRSYDSSGIAFLKKNKIIKQEGRIKNLKNKINEPKINLGIEHTR